MRSVTLLPILQPTLLRKYEKVLFIISKRANKFFIKFFAPIGTGRIFSAEFCDFQSKSLQFLKITPNYGIFLFFPILRRDLTPKSHDATMVPRLHIATKICALKRGSSSRFEKHDGRKRSKV